jgi:hypothetical protein
VPAGARLAEEVGVSTRTISAVVASALTLAACAGRTVIPVADRQLPPQQTAELWVEPDRDRDLFWGIGGERYAPDPSAAYTLVSKDESGFSIGYDVTGPDGTEWSVKVGPEAQTEVVVSRMLWGIGYHQPPVYYLPSWTLQAGDDRQTLGEARFRPKLPALERLEEPWRWQDNPFMGTREFRGLLVALLMVNSTDLKDDNNSVYQLREPWDGAARWFVVRDLGASLGEVGRFYPRRNWLDGFERHPFITRVDGSRVEFDFGGLQQELLSLIHADDVRWAARLMARLSGRQWQDAFRAAGYPAPVAERYIRRIERKIEDGLAVRVDAAVLEDR